MYSICKHFYRNVKYLTFVFFFSVMGVIELCLFAATFQNQLLKTGIDSLKPWLFIDHIDHPCVASQVCIILFSSFVGSTLFFFFFLPLFTRRIFSSVFFLTTSSYSLKTFLDHPFLQHFSSHICSL